ncbi:MAG: S1/P1 nuclease [Gammaproteobacteria bacterium]|nr:MAG: S1/P1 nuclease [Gammaproteobacteria bacterium]
MRSKSVLAALLTIASAYPPGVPAWGGLGHRTMGAIADRLLGPTARAGVAELLSGDVDKFGAPSGRRTLESVADWADEISGTPAARPRWHYDDAPVCGSAPKTRYCPEGQCNTGQLERLLTVVGDTHATKRERNEALKWVVHLVGDVHQPLHAADNADRGGNLVTVALAGVRTRGRESLHRAWDNELVGQALKTGRHRRVPADIGALAVEAGRLTGRAGPGTPDGWALESNELARTVAYHYPAFVCGTVPSQIVVLDRDYQARAAAIVRERLLLAGARLAGVLNERLGRRVRGTP